MLCQWNVYETYSAANLVIIPYFDFKLKVSQKHYPFVKLSHVIYRMLICQMWILNFKGLRFFFHFGKEWLNLRHSICMTTTFWFSDSQSSSAFFVTHTVYDKNLFFSCDVRCYCCDFVRQEASDMPKWKFSQFTNHNIYIVQFNSYLIFQLQIQKVSYCVR